MKYLEAAEFLLALQECHNWSTGNWALQCHWNSVMFDPSKSKSASSSETPIIWHAKHNHIFSNYSVSCKRCRYSQNPTSVKKVGSTPVTRLQGDIKLEWRESEALQYKGIKWIQKLHYMAALLVFVLFCFLIDAKPLHFQSEVKVQMEVLKSRFSENILINKAVNKFRFLWVILY